jgi:hypothetical protein
MKTELVLLGRHFKLVSRGSRRRLVLIFYAAFAALIAVSWLIDPSGFGAAFMTVEFTILLGPILGGYLCGWFKPFNVGLVKPFGGNEVLSYSAKKNRSALSTFFYPEEGSWGIRNDERELGRRDHAHLVAYRWVSMIGMIAFLIQFVDSSPLHRYVDIPATFIHRIIYLFLQAGYILSLTLPPAIILWTEPDMEVPQ